MLFSVGILGILGKTYVSLVQNTVFRLPKIVPKMPKILAP